MQAHRQPESRRTSKLPKKLGSGKPMHPAGRRWPRTLGHGKPTCQRGRLPPRGEPLTSAGQEQRQEETVAAKHQAAGESSSPSQERTVAKDVRHQVCSDPGAGDKVEEGGYWSDTAETVRVETMPTDPGAGNETMHHTSALRRQLIRFLEDGSEYFTPESAG